MGRRAELTLGGLIFVALLATGLLIWGQQSGKFKIFGDAFVEPSQTAPLALLTQAATKTIVTESFDSRRFFDPATTADWNIEAGEVTLPYGVSEGIVRSRQINNTTGAKVWIQLTALEDRPVGSTIYYAVSADDGATWQTLSDIRPAVFVNPLGRWRWRAYLARGVASRPPALQELTLTFFTSTS